MTTEDEILRRMRHVTLFNAPTKRDNTAFSLLANTTHFSGRTRSATTTASVKKSALIVAPAKNSPVLLLGQLLIAIRQQDCKRVKLLSKKVGAEKKYDIKYLLHEAAFQGCVKCCSYLVRFSEIAPDTPDDDGWTPLHSAVISGSESMIRYFIELYLNIDVLTKTGLTPLHVAVMTNSLDAVHLLVCNRANLYLATDTYSSPFQTAIDLGRQLILDYMILSEQHKELWKGFKFTNL